MRAGDIALPSFARRPVLAVAAVMVMLELAVASRYGIHRDERPEAQANPALRRGSGCNGPGTWPGGTGTGRSSTWGGPMIR
jgi:hypothetical protein